MPFEAININRVLWQIIQTRKVLMRKGSASNPMNRPISAASKKKAVKAPKKELHPAVPDLPNQAEGHHQVAQAEASSVCNSCRMFPEAQAYRKLFFIKAG
jgi:hypothetical protein